MGHTTDSTGKPIYAATPAQTVADLQAGVEFADKIGGLLKGTATDRAALTPDNAKDGWLFAETDTGRIYIRRGGGWERFAGYSRGAYVGSSGTGVVTVNHGLGAPPAAVQVTDRNAGGAIATRKIVKVTANATQIQFAVYNTIVRKTSTDPAPQVWELESSLLAANPIEFEWVAFL